MERGGSTKKCSRKITRGRVKCRKERGMIERTGRGGRDKTEVRMMKCCAVVHGILREERWRGCGRGGEMWRNTL